MSGYSDDLPTDHGYMDRREETARWRQMRPVVEAEWLRPVRARLQKGEALTSDLAAAAGIKPGLEYSRFLVMLARLEKLGIFRKTGKRRGLIHMNNVWQAVA